MLLGDAYTLVVPTYNRPEMLTALLRYLERSGAAFQVLVLDVLPFGRSQVMFRSAQNSRW